MRALGTGTTNHLAATSGIIAKRLVSIAARNTATGQIEPIRFWTGDTTTNFTIDGVGMIFEGIQGAIQSEPIEYSVGMGVRYYQITITAAGDIETMLRDHDLQSAKISVYGVVLNPVAPVGDPYRDIDGVVNSVSIETGKVGDSNKIVLTVATTAIYLVQSLDRKWSDATQQRDAPGVSLASDTTYTTSQTVSLGPNSTLDLVVVAGQNGTDGFGENGAPGQAGGSTTCVVKDAGGATIHTYTAVGASPIIVTGLADANNGSVVLTIGVGGAGGMGTPPGVDGADGYVGIAVATSAPIPDRFFQYTATAGEVTSKWA